MLWIQICPFTMLNTLNISHVIFPESISYDITKTWSISCSVGNGAILIRMFEEQHQHQHHTCRIMLPSSSPFQLFSLQTSGIQHSHLWHLEELVIHDLCFWWWKTKCAHTMLKSWRCISSPLKAISSSATHLCLVFSMHIFMRIFFHSILHIDTQDTQAPTTSLFLISASHHWPTVFGLKKDTGSVLRGCRCEMPPRGISTK